MTSNHRPVRKWISRAALVAALAISATACGDDDSNADDSNADDSTSESVSEAPRRIVYQPASQTMTSLPRQRALQSGCLEERNIEVELLPDSSDSSRVAAMVARGQIDMADPGASGAIVARSEGQDVVGLATTSQVPLFVLSLTTDTVDALADEGVTPKSPIEDRIRALSGLTIATTPPGSLTDLLLRQTLAANGVDPERDVTIQPVGDVTALPGTARAGQADGYVTSVPGGLLGVHEGWATEWINYGKQEVPGYEQMPSLEVITSPDFIAEHRDTVKDFLACLEEARVELVEGSPEVLAELKEEYYPQLDDELFALSLETALPGLKLGLVPREEGFMALLDLVNSDRPSPVDIAFGEQYDTTIIEEVVSEAEEDT